MNKQKKMQILIGLGIVLAFSSINFNSTIYFENETLKITASSEKIFIDGNSGWVAFKNAGRCTGNGTYSNPYIIENLEIDGGGSGNCILIENSDVYFTIKNCAIYNSERIGDYAGIKLFNVKNALLINNNCSLNDVGLLLENCENNTISGNVANDGTSDGIRLDNCINNIISDNIASNGRWNGIRLEDCNNNTISGNIANNKPFSGISLEDSDHNTISGNTANEMGIAGGSGMFLHNSNDNVISGNSINNNSGMGIFIRQSINNNVTGNRLQGNRGGIAISASDCIIANNTIKCNRSADGNIGINLDGDNNTVSGNVMEACGLWIGWSVEDLFSNNVDGTNLVNGKFLYYYTNEVNLEPSNFTNAGQVFLINCNDSTLSNLNISNTTIGLALYYCNYNYILGNVANNNLRGIYLLYSNKNHIIENNVSNNRIGIQLYSSIDNQISENTVSNNVEAIDTSWDCNHTKILDNIANNNNYGIILHGLNITVSGNILNECGLTFFEAFDMLVSHKIDTSNLVNGLPVYYYIHEVNLGPNDFSNAGQVVLVNCTNSVISDVNISFCSYGISLYYCNNNTVSGNSVKNNHNGIYLSHCEFSTISNNIACYNEHQGINLYSCINSSILGNSVNYNGAQGIHLIYSNHNQVSENSVNFNGNAGIDISQSDFNYVYNNIVDNNFDLGIVLKYSDNNEIIENCVSNNTNGGISVHSDNSVVVGNIAEFNGYGIRIYHGDKNTITGNSVSNNTWVGFYLYGSTYNLVSENYIYNNALAGLYLEGCWYNLVSENYINKHAYAIHLESSYNNSIYYNNFVNNDYNSMIEPFGAENTWNSEVALTYTYKGKKYTNFLGNYWDNYGGNDADNDGIGDAPFIQVFFTDYYPLMEPIENYETNEVLEPIEPEIFGYNFFFLVGILFVVVFVIRKKLKNYDLVVNNY